MLLPSILFYAVLVTSQVFRVDDQSSDCKCTPQQACWPQPSQWSNLNDNVFGKLIATQPVAVSCYPGPTQDQAICAYIIEQWTNASFQAHQPLGLDYPLDPSCPPVDYTAGETVANCSIGSNSIYAINATTHEDIAAGLVFASQHNLRLIIKTTGHDLLGRSEGYGGLQIWLRYLRTGIDFQQQYSPSSECTLSNWTGSAIKIGGGYTWSDVYPIAEANEVIVVGGGTPTVGCSGGWRQGGGHGPASRQFGLEADQVLEAEVVLANGSLVTAGPCENSDLLFAIRGVGPGSYGVVVSTTVKAWPTVQNLIVQHLAIAPLMEGNSPALLDAISITFAAFPYLNDAGYAGYDS